MYLQITCRFPISPHSSWIWSLFVMMCLSLLTADQVLLFDVSEGCGGRADPGDHRAGGLAGGRGGGRRPCRPPPVGDPSTFHPGATGATRGPGGFDRVCPHTRKHLSVAEPGSCTKNLHDSRPGDKRFQCNPMVFRDLNSPEPVASRPPGDPARYFHFLTFVKFVLILAVAYVFCDKSHLSPDCY